MLIRTRQTVFQSGRISEIMAMTAFATEGADIAIPLGISASWDFVVFEDGKWSKVQVKTAQPHKTILGATCSIRRRTHNGISPVYAPDSFDLLVAVIPESGEMWKIPISNLNLSIPTVKLLPQDRWKLGKFDQFDSWIPVVNQSPFMSVKPSRSSSSSTVRTITEPLIENVNRPDSIPQQDWDMLCDHVLNRLSYSAITHKFGYRDATNIRRRIFRAAIQMGADLPDSLRDKANAPRDADNKYERSHARLLLKDRIANMTRPEFVEERYWDALKMHILEGKSYPEITRHLGFKNVKNIRQKLGMLAAKCHVMSSTGDNEII